MPNYSSPTNNNNNNNNTINNSPSQVYSESLDQEPSYLTEEISQLQQDQDEIDSLIDVSEEELEQRVLELLSSSNDNDNNNNEQYNNNKFEEELNLINGIGKNGWNLPRILNLDLEEETLEVLSAQNYLRKCINLVDESDWIYKLPNSFNNNNNDPRNENNQNGEGTEWIDKAFNLESYRTSSYSLNSSNSTSGESIEEEAVEVEGGDRFGEGGYQNFNSLETGAQFADITSSLTSTHEMHGLAYMRESQEEDAVGAGFNEGRTRR